MGVWLVLVALPLLTPCGAGAAPSFNFPDFASTDGLTLAGGVVPVGNALQMTKAAQQQVAAVYVNTPQDVTQSFKASFTFSIANPRPKPKNEPNGADGFGFVVHNDPRSPLSSVLGAPGSGLGWYSTDKGNNATLNSLAVFLHTYGHYAYVTQNKVYASYGLLQPLGKYGHFGSLVGGSHTMDVLYDAGAVSITMLVDGQSIGQDNVVLPQPLTTLVGGDTAYFGVTSATGYYYSKQTLSAFSAGPAVPEPSGICAVIAAGALRAFLRRRSRRPRRCSGFGAENTARKRAG
jgi:hypothetical protein